MKVLISAFSCGPGRGSDPGVGWNWVQQVSRRHEVWLITTDEYQEDIERAITPNIHVTFLPAYRTWSRLQKMFIPGLDWLYYYCWQWKAYQAGRRLHAEVGFDLAHNVTFASWRVPSFLCLLPVPMVWGPVGGGGAIPAGLRGELGWKGRLFEGIRHLCQQASRYDPLVRLTMRRATVILAGNQETAQLVPASRHSKVRLMSCGGMSPKERLMAVVPGEKPAGFIILFVALLRPLKGGSLAIRAMQRLSSRRADAKLLFLGGGGQERARLEALVRELGLAGQVQFLGGLPRAQVLGWMEASDALLFPSLRDSGPMVVLEAMNAGKPVVCLDLGGPGFFVTEKCGIKVKPGNPEQVISDLAAALEKLAGDPGLRRAMGEAGRQRVRETFDWDKRGERMMEIYREAVGKVEGQAGLESA